MIKARAYFGEPTEDCTVSGKVVLSVEAVGRLVRLAEIDREENAISEELEDEVAAVFR